MSSSLLGHSNVMTRRHSPRGDRSLGAAPARRVPTSTRHCAVECRQSVPAAKPAFETACFSDAPLDRLSRFTRSMMSSSRVTVVRTLMMPSQHQEHQIRTMSSPCGLGRRLLATIREDLPTAPPVPLVRANTLNTRPGPSDPPSPTTYRRPGTPPAGRHPDCPQTPASSVGSPAARPSDPPSPRSSGE